MATGRGSRYFLGMASRLGSALRRGWHSPRLRLALVVILLGGPAFGGALLLGAWSRACVNGACPSIAVLSEYDPDQAAKVYAADGRLLADLGLQRRTVIPVGEMSPAILAAFVAIEDKRFYEHHGVDWARVPGAVWANVKAAFGQSTIQGFSSITMQLARNLWPEEINPAERRGIAGIRRKLREIRVARDIERSYSKDKILELYLNQVDLGNRAFGVEAASQRYFGKSARDVNVAEAAMLAAVVNGPTVYNPRRNPGFALRRRNTVINLLRDQGKLSELSAEAWKAYPVRLSSRSDYTGVADYFVEHVRQVAQSRFGMELYRAGYRIHTTLDLDIQQAAERAMEEQLKGIEEDRFGLGRFPHRSYAEYLEQGGAGGGETSPYLQGMVVTMDARTGAILAMVGGRDFEDSKFNRATQALRQAGSTFKPFVYSAALRAGIPFSRLYEDAPLSVEIPDQPPWEPQNFDGRFLGPMTVREALYRSQNIIAAKVGLELGEELVAGEAAGFGLTTRIPRVPSIYLGSAEVYPLEMVAAYSAFATQGTRVTPNPIDRVEDRNGNIVWQPRPQRTTVMEPAHAWIMLDGLRDVVRRGTANPAILQRGRFTIPSGGKTGTTNDYYDVWYIGFTADIVTGVWIGFDQPKRIKNNAQGGLLAAPIWANMMREVYERRPAPPAWRLPDGVVAAEIDQSTGYLASPTCPTAVRTVEYFLPGTEPFLRCPLHGRDQIP